MEIFTVAEEPAVLYLKTQSVLFYQLTTWLRPTIRGSQKYSGTLRVNFKQKFPHRPKLF